MASAPPSLPVSAASVQLGQLAVPGMHPELTGYLCRPVTETSGRQWPGVVMVHEAFGLNDVTRRQAEHLASLGYVVLAPDLFARGGYVRCLISTFRTLLSGQGPAFADIEAARQLLSGDPQCSGRIGVIGFCMGGGFALALATRGFEASAPCYGQLPRPIDQLEDACPIVASYGGKDLSLRGAAAKLDAALARHGVAHDVKEYPGAGHSFMNDDHALPAVFEPLLRVAGVQPDPVAAADAWARIDAFFSTHLDRATPAG